MNEAAVANDGAGLNQGFAQGSAATSNLRNDAGLAMKVSA